MIQHHLPEAMLLDYATGAARPADALLVASHLTLCPTCRARLRAAEELGAALLEEHAPSDVSDDLLGATLAQLDASEPPPPPPRHDPSGVLPEPLAAVAGPFAQLPWTWQFPGVEMVVLDVPHEGMPARLFRIAKGGFIPPHAHPGEETSLVLTGGFTDASGHFARGDVCACEPGSTHGQRMDDHEPCVVLTLADAPFRPRSPLALIASLWRGF